MAETALPDLFDDIAAGLRTVERVSDAARAKATSLESELAAALQRETKLIQDMGKLEAKYKTAQMLLKDEKKDRVAAENALRTKEAEFEAREKTLRAEEEEIRKDRAELAEDLARTTQSMQKIFERHTVKLSTTNSDIPKGRYPLISGLIYLSGRPRPFPLSVPDDEPASKRTKLQEPTDSSTPSQKNTQTRPNELRIIHWPQPPVPSTPAKRPVPSAPKASTRFLARATPERNANPYSRQLTSKDQVSSRLKRRSYPILPPFRRNPTRGMARSVSPTSGPNTTSNPRPGRISQNASSVASSSKPLYVDND
ncbi:hypothetical protein C8R43DRAFT_1119715 [Mycena crocata]|nr:hypothetical protein C8R43DRAFT_1119715 [Mycena crocata]